MDDAVFENLRKDDQDLCREYQRQIAQGQHKTHAPETLQNLITNIRNYSESERKKWVSSLLHNTLDKDVDSHLNLPLPLFENVVLIELKKGFDNGEPFFARWIAQTFDLIVRVNKRKLESERIIDSDKLKPFEYFQIAINQNSEDKIAQQALIKFYADNLNYAIHEVPQGLLTNDMEWLNQALNDLEILLLAAGLEETYKTNLNLWRFHINLWEDYLARRDEYASYKDYLDDNSNGFDWRFKPGIG